MRQLLYVSNTARAVAPDTLDAILAASRRNNADAGITGMLLHLDGAFLQVLEGEPPAVAQTYARICGDTRHWGPRVLIDQQVPARAFAQWSMGFHRLPPGGLDADRAFLLSRDAVAAALMPGAPVEIGLLLETFQRVHGGKTLSPI